MNVFLIRHGETVWSLDDRHTATTDIPLTDNGRRLAERLKPFLAKHPFRLALLQPHAARERPANWQDLVMRRSPRLIWSSGTMANTRG